LVHSCCNFKYYSTRENVYICYSSRDVPVYDGMSNDKPTQSVDGCAKAGNNGRKTAELCELISMGKVLKNPV
jgi:hypothetical protein